MKAANWNPKYSNLRLVHPWYPSFSFFFFFFSFLPDIHPWLCFLNLGCHWEAHDLRIQGVYVFSEWWAFKELNFFRGFDWWSCLLVYLGHSLLFFSFSFLSGTLFVKKEKKNNKHNLFYVYWKSWVFNSCFLIPYFESENGLFFTLACDANVCLPKKNFKQKEYEEENKNKNSKKYMCINFVY